MEKRSEGIQNAKLKIGGCWSDQLRFPRKVAVLVSRVLVILVAGQAFLNYHYSCNYIIQYINL
jgi:hypothetical protein